MLDLFIPLPPEAVPYVQEYKIDITRIEQQNLELYSYIYIIQAHYFMSRFNDTDMGAFYTLALANLNRYIEINEELKGL